MSPKNINFVAKIELNMESGKIVSEIGKYIGSGVVFNDHPFYALVAIIMVTFINNLLKYMMREHRITSNEYTDENGNMRKITYMDR